MSVEENVQKVLAEDGKEREKSESFRSLRDFYQQMKNNGLVVEPEYTLPPMDTVGRSFCIEKRGDKEDFS